MIRFTQGGGLQFERLSDGRVQVHVGHQATENADLIRTVTYSPEDWAALVRQVGGSVVMEEEKQC